MANVNTINFYTQDQLFLYHNATATFDAPQAAIVPHSHPHYEIIQLLEGNTEFIIEGKVYRLESGDILLIRANDYHAIKTNATVYKRRVIEFEESYLQASTSIAEELLRPYNEKNENFDSLIPSRLVKTYHLDTMFDKIENTITDANKAEIFIPIHIMSLLVEINNILSSTPHKKGYHYLNSITTSIIKYIDEHISEKITLNDLEKAVNLSKYYISHLFKNTMGVSISGYIIERKMRHAEQLIRQGVTPTKASMMVGYYNYPNFYENYKKITNVTPKDTAIMIGIPMTIE